MVDAGASVYAVVGVAYINKCYVIMSPKKKLKSLFVEMDTAQDQYIRAASVIPADQAVPICLAHEGLLSEIKSLHKTRWGHWKNRSVYEKVRRQVEAHLIVEPTAVQATSRDCLIAACSASVRERLNKETAERTRSAEAERRCTAMEHSGCAHTSGAKKKSSSGSSDLTESIPLSLSTASLPLQYPVMVPLREAATQPSGLLGELEGLILDRDLIDFSDLSLDLTQREGILIDLSSEDADASTIYRISIGENDSSQMSHLLNNLFFFSFLFFFGFNIIVHWGEPHGATLGYLLEALPASILSLEIPADGCHAPDSPEYPTPFLTMTYQNLAPLNNLLVPPNVVSDTSALSDKPSATGAPYSASNSPQSPVPGVSAEIHSTEESASCFGVAATAQVVQAASNFASALSAIAGAIQDS